MIKFLNSFGKDIREAIPDPTLLPIAPTEIPKKIFQQTSRNQTQKRNLIFK